jgi:hypothetical protein
MTSATSASTLSQPWHAGLTPSHWRVLAASFLGWVFDGYEAYALDYVAWVFPILAGTMIQKFGGIPRAAMTLGLIYVLGLVVPWFVPETRGKPLPR